MDGGPIEFFREAPGLYLLPVALVTPYLLDTATTVLPISLFLCQVVPNDNRTPQKNANVISKAMEYMFGW